MIINILLNQIDEVRFTYSIVLIESIDDRVIDVIFKRYVRSDWF